MFSSRSIFYHFTSPGWMSCQKVFFYSSYSVSERLVETRLDFFFVACMETWYLLSSEERPCSFPDKVCRWLEPDSSRSYRSNEPVKIEIWGGYKINQSEGAVCISIKWLGNVWVLGCSPLQFSPQVWLRNLFVTALSNMNVADREFIRPSIFLHALIYN